MSTSNKWLWPVGIITAAAAVLALLAYGVAVETVLILGLLLLCPLMMLFMRGKNMHTGSREGQPGVPSDTHGDISGKDSR